MSMIYFEWIFTESFNQEYWTWWKYMLCVFWHMTDDEAAYVVTRVEYMVRLILQVLRLYCYSLKILKLIITGAQTAVIYLPRSFLNCSMVMASKSDADIVLYMNYQSFNDALSSYTIWLAWLIVYHVIQRNQKHKVYDIGILISSNINGQSGCGAVKSGIKFIEIK